MDTSGTWEIYLGFGDGIDFCDLLDLYPEPPGKETRRILINFWVKKAKGRFDPAWQNVAIHSPPYLH